MKAFPRMLCLVAFFVAAAAGAGQLPPHGAFSADPVTTLTGEQQGLREDSLSVVIIPEMSYEGVKVRLHFKAASPVDSARLLFTTLSFGNRGSLRGIEPYQAGVFSHGWWLEYASSSVGDSLVGEARDILVVAELGEGREEVSVEMKVAGVLQKEEFFGVGPDQWKTEFVLSGSVPGIDLHPRLGGGRIRFVHPTMLEVWIARRDLRVAASEAFSGRGREVGEYRVFRKRLYPEEGSVLGEQYVVRSTAMAILQIFAIGGALIVATFSVGKALSLGGAGNKAQVAIGLAVCGVSLVLFVIPPWPNKWFAALPFSVGLGLILARLLPSRMKRALDSVAG